jgi:hypothetical protein
LRAQHNSRGNDFFGRNNGLQNHPLLYSSA